MTQLLKMEQIRVLCLKPDRKGCDIRMTSAILAKRSRNVWTSDMTVFKPPSQALGIIVIFACVTDAKMNRRTPSCMQYTQHITYKWRRLKRQDHVEFRRRIILPQYVAWSRRSSGSYSAPSNSLGRWTQLLTESSC